MIDFPKLPRNRTYYVRCDGCGKRMKSSQVEVVGIYLKCEKCLNAPPVEPRPTRKRK